MFSRIAENSSQDSNSASMCHLLCAEDRNRASAQPKKESATMPAVIVGIVGAYLAKGESERVLDDLLQLFSGGTGKEAALREIQKVEKTAETTQRVSAAIQEAIRREGPFTFPEELSETELITVTRLDFRVFELTADSLRAISTRLPHLIELNLDKVIVSEEAADTFKQLKKLRYLQLKELLCPESSRVLATKIVRKILACTPQLKSLDLSYSQLAAEEIQELVVRCTELRQLNLSGIDPSVTVATLGKVVTHLPHLADLHLNSISVTKEMLDLLSQLQELQSLGLQRAQMKDDMLESLAKCSTLQILSLTHNDDITTVQPLAACFGLEELDLDSCKNLASLQGLSACEKLLSLNLSNCPNIKDFEILSTCINLRKLTLTSSGHLTNLKPLTGCTKLESLRICKCEVLSSLEGLSACKELWSLELVFCERITDFALLSSCTRLRKLTLANFEQLTGLEPIVGCIELEDLTIYECQALNSLQGLSAYKKLLSLALVSCKSIKNFEPLSSCTKLRKLSLIDCDQLKSLQQLAAYTKLEKLDLSGCTALTSLQPLLTCSQLRELVLPHTWDAPDMQAEKAALQQALPRLQFVDHL